MKDNEKILTTGKYKWKKNQDIKKKSINIQMQYFESMLIITIILGLLWHVYLLYDVFSRDAHFLFEIFYLSMNVLLIIMGSVSVFTDVRARKKLSYESVGLIIAFILLNFNLVMMIFNGNVVVELTLINLFVYYIAVGLGFLILFMILIRTFFRYYRSNIIQQKTLKQLSILRVSISTLVFALIILGIIVVVGLLSFFFSGNFIYEAQTFIDIGEIWDWGAFWRNFIIVAIAFIVIISIEIEVDVLFDFDDEVSQQIKRWRIRVFRKIGDFFRRIFRRD
jgi:hypothetical protein